MNKFSFKKTSDGNFLTSFLRSSVILTSIDRFTAYLYSLIQNGFFGYIFTGYRNDSEPQITSGFSQTKISQFSEKIRNYVCQCVDESFLVNLIRNFVSYLLSCKIKVYGTILATYSAVSIILTVINMTMNRNSLSLLINNEILFFVICIFSSLPLIFSRKNLITALRSSMIGQFVLSVVGLPKERDHLSDLSKGHTSIAFLIGAILAVITQSLSPIYVIGAFVCIIGLYLVLIRPEIGVLALFVLMPFLPTMLLAGIVIYTFLCWVLKLVRGKRVLRFEPIDIVVLAFAVILLSGGLVSLSGESLKPSLLMICLLLGYVLVVQLITTREWLIKCSVGTVLSATATALYGIFTYYTGSGYFSSAWVDDEMFGIANRAVSTLENPNMLGEYLIMIIPLALVMVIGREGLRRIPALFCVALLGGCLILTWSRGAWLALMVALLLFLFMCHHRSIWLIIIGVCSVPILPSILPQSIISRFTSIGNISDSSTSYRVYIWRAAVKMIKDNWFGGIGIGEGAWRRIYPLYSYMGIEAAPHSHNLFMQIWIDLGIFGIIAFIALVFLIFQSAFTLFKKLSSNPKLVTSDLTEKMMYTDKTKKNRRATIVQLRLSVIAPLTGIIAVLVQGLTDYSWYNYRLYLMFWLIVGLTSAYVRNGESFILTGEDIQEANDTNCQFLLKTKNKHKRKTSEEDS